MKRKNIILAISIIVVGALVVAGTYAYLVYSANVTNGTYNTVVECFDVVYDITNDDGTSNISGTLFPSASPSGGLYGKVTIKMNPSCNVTGIGNLYLDVDSKYNLVSYVNAYCSNATTFESVSEYTEQSTCEAAGYTWIEGGSALKYIIFDSSESVVSVGNILYKKLLDNGKVFGDVDGDGDFDGDDAAYIAEYDAGYVDTIDLEIADLNLDGEITISDAVRASRCVTGYIDCFGLSSNDDVSFEVQLYSDFFVGSTQEQYTIYIWMDGYLIDSTYESLSFGGNIRASVSQTYDSEEDTNYGDDGMGSDGPVGEEVLEPTS